MGWPIGPHSARPSRMDSIRFLGGAGRASLIALFAGVTAASLATSACSSDDAAATRPASDDVAEYELFSNTIVLDAPKLAVQSETGGKLVFTSPPASLDSVHKGSVLVAGMGTSTPRGLLRYVKSATRQGDVLTLETADAPPQLAFRKLHVRATRTTPMIGNLKSGWPAPSVLSASLLLSPQVASPPGSIPLFDLGGVDFKKTLPFDFYPFDGDGDLKTTSDQVHAHAEFYGAFKFNVGIDVDWGAVEDLPSAALDCVGEWLTGGSCNPMDLLPEAVVRLDVDSGLGAKALLEGAAYREFKVPVEFPSIALDPIPIGILVFFPSVEFYGEASGKASSNPRLERRSQRSRGRIDTRRVSRNPDECLAFPPVGPGDGLVAKKETAANEDEHVHEHAHAHGIEDARRETQGH